MPQAAGHWDRGMLHVAHVFIHVRPKHAAFTLLSLLISAFRL
jgi:hypothetical protein